MKQSVLIFIALLIAGCSSVPTKDSGMARVEVRAFFNGQNQLTARVTEIVNERTNKLIFSFEEKSFGSNDVIIPSGEYLVTYSCFQETGLWGTSFGGGQHPPYTEKMEILPGEDLRLTYEFINNIKYGNHCKPYFMTNL